MDKSLNRKDPAMRQRILGSHTPQCHRRMVTIEKIGGGGLPSDSLPPWGGGGGCKYVSRFRDKENFADVTVDDLAPVAYSDAADTEVWRLESMDDDEIDRLKAFVLALWTFTVTSLSAYRGRRGLDPKGAVDHKEEDDDEPSLPARSQGCTGAAEEEVVARRLAAMNTRFKVEGDCSLYTTKPGAEPMDVACTPVTACRACKSAGRGVKHHWFHECPGFD